MGESPATLGYYHPVPRCKARVAWSCRVRLKPVIFRYKSFVIGRRVDAARRMGDNADLYALPQRQDAELLELFDFFQWRRRPSREVEQEVAAISIKAQMLQEDAG